MPYSLANFTGAQDVQCLPGMQYSPVSFTGAPDAQCLQGMPYSLVKFTECSHPQTILLGAHGMLCTMYTRILKAVYHVCSETYHEALSLLQTVGVNITLQNGVLVVAPIHTHFGCDHHSLYLTVHHCILGTEIFWYEIPLRPQTLYR